MVKEPPSGNCKITFPRASMKSEANIKTTIVLKTKIENNIKTWEM